MNLAWISYNSSYDCQYYLSIIKYIISCFQLYNFFGKFPISCMQTFLLSNSLVLETKINLFFSHNYCPYFSFLGTLETFVLKVLVDFYLLNEHQITKIKLVLAIKALNKRSTRSKKEWNKLNFSFALGISNRGQSRIRRRLWWSWRM